MKRYLVRMISGVDLEIEAADEDDAIKIAGFTDEYKNLREYLLEMTIKELDEDEEE